MDNPWQDDFFFMKHILDRISYINDMYAGGAGRPEAMAELMTEVKRRATRFPTDYSRTSRMLHFANFLDHYDSMHPEVEQFLRSIDRVK